MKCIVTGGAGFIGKHLCRRLLNDGHQVFAIDNRRRGTALNVGTPKAPQYLPLYAEDIASDNCILWQLAPGVADVLFHLAAVSRTVPACEDPIECIRTNVLGTAKVLECARQAQIPRVVVSSSNVVFAGETPYKASKKAVEDLCHTYAKFYGQSVVALRYSNVYGPGIPPGDPAVFAMLRDSFLHHGFASVTGDGEQTRDFTHVSDIVEGNIKAAFHTKWSGTLGHSPVIDLCTGVQTSMNHACELLKIPVKYIAERPGDIKSMVQDSFTASIILDWRAKIELTEGIKDIWQTA